MKQTLLLLIACFAFAISNAQTQLNSISPNTLGLGQLNILTTISGVDLNFAGASPSSVRLIGPASLKGRQRTFLNNNSFTVKFSVPNLPSLIGTYSLHYLVYDSNTTSYTNYTLPNAVTVSSNSPTISGKIFHDINQNGVQDGGETPVGGAKVLLSPSSVSAFSNNQGIYAFFVQPGNHTINYASGINYVLSAGSPSSYNVTVSNQSTGNDFGVLSNYNNYATTCYNGFGRRCFDSTYHYINIDNLSNIGYSGHVDYILSPNMTYVSSGFPLSQIGDTLRWTFNINSISSLDFSSLRIANPAAGLTIASLLNVYANVTGSDSLVASNYFVWVTTCSFDPNDKSVTPQGAGLQHYTLFTDELQYQIRFQNTGNDTAYHVVIRDTLDSDLDLNTFRILGSSHTVNTELMPNGLLKFSFSYIYLPDSNVNEPASNGFVSYAIKAKTGLPENTFVDNTAYIYFDYNSAVVTNSTNNTMVSVIPTGIHDISKDAKGLSFIPNPASDFTQVYFINDAQQELTLSVFDVTGKEIFKELLFSDKAIINTSKFSSGIYLVRVTDNYKTNYCGKLEVLKK